MARPSKFDAEIAACIIAAVERGDSDRAAAEAGGITNPTYYSWLRAGTAGVEPFASFAEQVQRARRRFVNAQVETIRAAAHKVRIVNLLQIMKKRFAR